MRWTFQCSNLCFKNTQAWETHEAILIEDYLITRQTYIKNFLRCGARYLKEFSPRFPHFEVSKLKGILQSWQIDNMVLIVTCIAASDMQSISIA